LKEVRFSPDGRLLAVAFGTELISIDLHHRDGGIERLAAERQAEWPQNHLRSALDLGN
jgi:hypothetical protein